MFQGPSAKSLLGRHRVLSPSASVRVSPLSLGTTNFGTAWKEILGECSKETAFEILDYYYSQGGNFIDTANHYQGGQTEEWLGEWLQLRKNRDEIVLATKFSANSRLTNATDDTILSNFGGNSTKSLHHSIQDSLKKLGTDYIDVLYVHWWDFTTSPAELMSALNTLVQQGKVLYLGVSDTPAWYVVKCNEYARQHHMRPFVVYTGRWSAAERDMEREILEMCAAEDMAVAPWGVLGGGRFKTAEAAEKEKGEGRIEVYPKRVIDHQKVAVVLNRIAQRLSTLPTSVAMAYAMQKQAYVVPIIGGRKLEHLKANIDGLSVELQDADIRDIENATDFDRGFPYNILNFEAPFRGPQDLALMTGTFDYVGQPKAIKPHTEKTADGA